MTDTGPTGTRSKTQERSSTDGSENVSEVLHILGHDQCRELLGMVHVEVLTADELTARSDMSRSTVYRLLDELLDAELIEERVRISGQGNHKREYRSDVRYLGLSFEPDGTISVEIFESRS